MKTKRRIFMIFVSMLLLFAWGYLIAAKVTMGLLLPLFVTLIGVFAELSSHKSIPSKGDMIPLCVLIASFFLRIAAPKLAPGSEFFSIVFCVLFSLAAGTLVCKVGRFLYREVKKR